MAKQQVFISLKDNKLSCRLINPAKSELGVVSKKIIEHINNTIREQARLNQWKNSAAVTEWLHKNTKKRNYCIRLFLST